MSLEAADVESFEVAIKSREVVDGCSFHPSRHDQDHAETLDQANGLLMNPIYPDGLLGSGPIKSFYRPAVL